MMANVVWTPQPRQAALMVRFEDKVLYGDAAGGGKSDCVLAEALRQVEMPHYRGLIPRKTFSQLTELTDRSTEIYKRTYKKARFNESKHVWTFPSGAKISPGSMRYTKDWTNYQGKRCDFIDFDELTQSPWEEYGYLFPRNRPSGPGTRCYIRAQVNPGDAGHGWVRERFTTVVQPMQMIWGQFKVRFPDGHEETRRKSRIFVLSSVFDSRILPASSPGYLISLASMPEQERKALLYGDWDTFAGQVFMEWRNDSDHCTDHINTHVASPFEISQNWAIWCGLDWGYSGSFSVGRYAVNRDRRPYCIQEYYGYTDISNTGAKVEPPEVARETRRIEAEDPNLKDRRINRVGNPAIWGSDGTESIGAPMERQRVYFERGGHARISGKMQVYHRLTFDEEGIPTLYVFNTCKHFIRTVSNLVYDEKNVEDISTEGEDYIYDELRYVCMENPVTPRRNKSPFLVVYDPLDLGQNQQYDRYDFYRRC